MLGSTPETDARSFRHVWNRIATWLDTKQGAAIILVAILVLGAIFRFTGVDWDDGTHLHPDERFLTMVENGLEWPESMGEYWDTSINPLNPYNKGFGSYVYGILPVVLAKILGQVTGYTGYSGVYLAGRVMSGMMDLICVLLVYLIGKALYGRKTGLLSALLFSSSVLSIQHAHFFTVDSSTTLFVTLALYAAIRVAKGGGWGSILLLGVSFGLAVSSKISVLTFLLVIGLALVQRVALRCSQAEQVRRGFLGRWYLRFGRLRLTCEAETPSECPETATDSFLMRLLPAAFTLLVVVLTAFFVFRIVQPQAFTGPGFFDLEINEQWLDDMDYIQRLVSGEIDYPPSHQWTDRAPIWYMFKHMVLWGLGLPLGIAVWASWCLIAYEMFFKKRWEHLLPWTWMTLTFFYQSIQFVKTVRYLLPIYPTMAVLAGYGLMFLLRWGRERAITRSTKWLRGAACGAVTAVVVGTILWATAFMHIYSEPVTRLSASRWIYENIPAGSTLTFELWDDPLPLNIDGHNASYEYDMIRMDLYWEDIPEKRDALYSWLDQAEYIVLSSNRLYRSIPRLASRYPMTTRYYEALFSGELGFELVAEFTSRPTLLGAEIVDDESDETFTVYDHPRVTIYHKTNAYDAEAVRALFDDYDLERIARVRPVEISEAPDGLMLSEMDRAEQQAGGTWSEMFDRDSVAHRLPVLTWLITLAGLAVPVFVLGFPLLRGLRDHGHGFSLILSLLLVGWLSWLAASMHLLPFTRGALWAIVSALWVGAICAGWRWRHELYGWLREHWRLLVVQDIVFLSAFALFVYIRSTNPDLWHPVMGGEKPMDLAYLNAVVKSTWFPAYDPWFAGGYINYYYFGFVLSAVMVKLSAVVPTTAYNLLIPTFFAMTASGVVAVVYNVWPRAQKQLSGLGAGVVGAVLALCAGNLGELQLLWNGFKDLALARGVAETSTPAVVRAACGFWEWLTTDAVLSFRPEWWYWNATRVMRNGEINEFPFFSFLYGDLHAHVMAMPLAVLALGLAINLVYVLRNDPDSHTSRSRAVLWLSLGASALALGALWCTNTWDYPTYTVVTMAALAIGLYGGLRRINLEGIRTWVLLVLALVAMSLVFFLPFHAEYGSAYSSIERWEGETSDLGSLLIILSVLYVPLVSGLVGAALRRGIRSAGGRRVRLWGTQLSRSKRATHLYDLLVRCQSVAYQYLWVGLWLMALIEVMALFAGAWALFLCLPVLFLGAWLALSADSTERHRLAGVLAAAGAALIIGVEYVVLQGDIGRMNTVFKFYLQVWILWAIASAILLPPFWRAQGAWKRWARMGWRVLFVLLVTAGMLYPTLATWGKTRDRWSQSQTLTLDGTAFMESGQYNDGKVIHDLAEDKAAIQWLQENVDGSPVVMEGVGQLYRWGSRVSSYTGLPVVIGWDWHQRQQRSVSGGARIDWRLQDVAEFYNTDDTERALEILRLYDVSYVLVGQFERSSYTAFGLGKFEEMAGESLEIAFQQGDTVIYRVVDVSHTATVSNGGIEAWLARHWIGTRVRADDGAMDPLNRETVDSRGWNKLAAVSDIAAVTVWWILMWLLGIAAWPLIASVFRGLPGRGYGLARTAGVLLISLILWLGASLHILRNDAVCAWCVFAVLVILGILSYRRQPRLWAVWKRYRHDLVRTELIFTTAFVLFVVIRMLNPDLWQPWFGGEKMMEIAFLNAVSKSAYMPPYDPYLAGATINYYYYGLFMVNVLQKLTGLSPEVAFNLAVPSLFALTVSNAYVLGRWLSSELFGEHQDSRPSVMGGLGAVTCVAFLANLSPFTQLVEQLARAGGASFGSVSDWQWSDMGTVVQGMRNVLTGAASLGSFEYWYHGTRIIPFTINEFPFFSFLFADLHPHMIALPFMIFVAALALALLSRANRRFDVRMMIIWFGWSLVALGALGPMNTWALPGAVILMAGALLMVGWQREGWQGAAYAFLVSCAMVFLAVLLYAPFYASFSAPDAGIALVPSDARSPLILWLVVWGVLLVPTASCLGQQLRFLRPGRVRRATWLVLALGILGGAVLAALGYSVLGCCLAMTLLSVWLFIFADDPVGHMIGLLLALGWGMLLGVEIIYLPDFLSGGDWFRMNTVFKFGIQTWVYVALVVGASLPFLWHASRRLTPVFRWSWRVGMALVLSIGFSYVPLSIPVRVAQRFPDVAGRSAPRPMGLDGLAYMNGGVYTWPDVSNPIDLRYDLEAIKWLWNNVDGAPVLLEANVGYYREGGMRISSYTGLPTVVGAHSAEQHDWQTVLARQNDVSVIYNTLDEGLLFDLLSRYDVRYIYVGQLERAMYNPSALAKFEALTAEGQLQCVYRNTMTTIYEVPAPA